MDTTHPPRGTLDAKEKGRVFTRPAGTFSGRRCRYCFGVSVGFGAGGLLDGVVELGFGTAGFAPLGFAGAATPDCVLYASTTGLVMSTASPHHSTLLCGHGLDVS